MSDLGKTVEKAFEILKRHNLVNIPPPVLKKNQPHGTAEESNMAITYHNVTAVRRSLTFPSVHAQYARTIRSLSVSLDIPSNDMEIDGKMLLKNLALILRSLPALTELTITGKQTPHLIPRDIFRGCSFSLEKLHCTLDKLLAASWSSLPQRTIRDFRGFLDVVDGPPSDVLPWNMASLEYLETSAHFAERLTIPAKITHLSLHTNRARTRPTLCHLSNLLGDQLISLRVNRTLVASKSPPAEVVEDADVTALLWQSDSPIMISCMLRTPNLKYLEIRDKSLLKWSVNAHSVRDIPWVREIIGTPSLERLVWRPAWAKHVRQLNAITTEHIQDCFALLPANFVAIPVEESDLGKWRVSLRGQVPGEFEEHWPFCAIREDSWRI
ncbi:hypothetical protein L226DRAFT_611303 [Lentinus tigrinus ALCF2SS1-7]|uniref:uncharacterized protein n=1 Tax=Lentinus tigrinus ALCF2SS1-7 TaxID=1328758 RepID=UPI0011661660|nr:hypothetical protein L226DRAFT_611303 [Lentinus tigrinus ALCF2SS1-7]